MGTNDYLDPIWDTDDTPVARAKADPEGARYRLQEATMAAWAAFARTGNPSNPLLPIWPAHTLDRRATMVFDSTSRVVDDPQADVRKIITG
jgi:para-nitrobenzyl esterase